jgi:broad specificity phosphatase PhoE
MFVENGSLILMRHGRTSTNDQKVVTGINNPGLTELGGQQVAVAAKALEHVGITIVYHAPPKRTEQTARIAADVLGISNIKEHPGLAERDLSRFSGIPFNELSLHAETVKIGDRDYVVSGANGDTEGIETFPALYKRAESTLVDIAQRHPSEHVLLVTHSIIGAIMHAAYNGLSWEEGLEVMPLFPNAGMIRLSSSAEK